MMVLRIKLLSSAFAFTFLLSTFVVHAQNGEVSGTISDSLRGEVLPGANVLVVGTQMGTSTGPEGYYTIEDVSPGTYEVQASFVGYSGKTKEVIVEAGETAELNFALAPSATQLEGVAVVATGYGVQRAEDVTSAIASVDSSDFVAGSARDIGSLLENQVAGLSVNQPSGDPREGSSISLRGLSTIQASSSPLVLIDGVPGSLDDVSRQDVASIDVLKGGSAAAIYGSRASNGVILITTEGGRGGAPTRVEYNGSLTYDRIKNQPDFLSAEEIRSVQEEYGSQYPDLPIANYTDYGNNTNWTDQVLREPLSQDHHLSFTGGDASTSYRASLYYENRQGVFERSDNQEMKGRLGASHSMLDGALTADLNVTGNVENAWNGLGIDVWELALKRNPTDQARNEEGGWQERPAVPEYANPLSVLHERNGDFESSDLRLNGTLKWNPWEGLSLSVLGARNIYNQTSSFSETFAHVSTTLNGLNGRANKSSYTNRELLLEATGTYTDEVGNHDFDVLGGYSWQENVDENFSAYNEDFPTDQFGSDNLGAGDGLTEGRASVGSGRNAWALIGFFGRVNYNYDDRYLLMGSLRYEGNSKFGANNKWGAFPAMSAGWRIAQESFMEGIDFIDQLKLRAGYGVTGIAPSASYQSLASFGYEGSFFSNGEWVQGLVPTRNPNPNLRWERKTETNIGLDFAFLDDRLGGSVDVYRRTTSDLLFDYSVPVPPNLYDEITANVGEMRNEGIEASLRYSIIEGDGFRWSTNANISANRNELIQLSNDEFQTENNFFNTGAIGLPVGQPSHRVEVGQPIGNFYGFKSVGLNEDGIWMIESKEGEIIPWTDQEFDDKQVIGNGVPNYFAGWNHTFQYGDFDARVSMGGAFDFQTLNATRLFFGTPRSNERNWLDSAFEEVDGQLVRNREAWVSHWLEDGDYWKIETITLGYSTGSIMDVISNSRIYITGRNLFTLTGYSGIDPEVDTSGLAPGYDPRFKYPNMRSFTMGVNLSL